MKCSCKESCSKFREARHLSRWNNNKKVWTNPGLVKQASGKTDLQPTGQSLSYRWEKQTPSGVSRLSWLTPWPELLIASSFFFTPTTNTELWGGNNVILWVNELFPFIGFQSKTELWYHCTLLNRHLLFSVIHPLVFWVIGCPCSSHWSWLFWHCVCSASQGSPPLCCAGLRQVMLLQRSPVTNSALSLCRARL